MDSTFLSHLDWRFAVKEFDPNRKVSDQDLDKILESIHMAPTSFGLQPYHVFVVRNPELRQKLREKGYDQPKITDASHYFVFASRTDLAERVEAYFEIAAGGNAEARAAMKGYEDMMRGFVQSLPAEESKKTWADRQTYIALGFALAACAELGIDSGPMEGFNPTAYDEILNLPPHLKSVVCMGIGYRAHESQHPKVRFAKEELVTVLK